MNACYKEKIYNRNRNISTNYEGAYFKKVSKSWVFKELCLLDINNAYPVGKSR